MEFAGAKTASHRRWSEFARWGIVWAVLVTLACVVSSGLHARKRTGATRMLDMLPYPPSAFELAVAASRGDVASVESLARALVPLNVAFRMNEAIALDLSRRIAELGVDEPEGYRALHFATIHGHAATVRRLLELGADPNVLARGDPPDTPLAIAARTGRPDLVRLLLNWDARVVVPGQAWMGHGEPGSCDARSETKDPTIQQMLGEAADQQVGQPATSDAAVVRAAAQRFREEWSPQSDWLAQRWLSDHWWENYLIHGSHVPGLQARADLIRERRREYDHWMPVRSQNHPENIAYRAREPERRAYAASERQRELARAAGLATLGTAILLLALKSAVRLRGMLRRKRSRPA